MARLPLSGLVPAVAALVLACATTMPVLAQSWLSRPITIVADDRADLISFGRPFIANPDLVHRLRHGCPLNEIDQATLRGHDHRGSTDYPFADEAEDCTHVENC